MSTEYLGRPLIEGVNYEISETKVLIQSTNTCFVSCVLPELCKKNEVIGQYRRVLRAAKEQGVKISYSRHIRRTIRERWDDYLAEREKQERLFLELRETADVIRRRGIHAGHADDEELAKAYEIAGELAKLNYRDRAIRKIADLSYDLQMLECQLSDMNRRCDVIAL